MNLYLIGFRGSGKSTIAPLVAQHLGWSFDDTDEQVVLLAGCPISQIFEEYGEATFREWETNVLQALSHQSSVVVSTGGGCPLSNVNRDLMDETGKIVWLRAGAEVLWSRIDADKKSKAHRPNLTEDGGLVEVQRVLESRISIYEACADYTVDVESLSPEQIAEQIANWMDPVDN